MKILLDIDGVMVPIRYGRPPELSADGFAAFSTIAVSSLQRIIAETGASIVLTTSHKANYTIAEWEHIFNGRGILTKIEKLETPIQGLSRKDEILNWFSKQESKDDFVIIDDDTSLNDLPIELKARLVLTSPMIGLTQEHATSAIEMLHRSVSLQC